MLSVFTQPVLRAVSVALLLWAFEDTFTTFEIQIWLPDFILGMNSIRIFCGWPIWADVTRYPGSDILIFSLSIDRQLIRITAWSKLGMPANKEKSGNKYTGSYFTVVKVSLLFKLWIMRQDFTSIYFDQWDNRLMYSSIFIRLIHVLISLPGVLISLPGVCVIRCLRSYHFGLVDSPTKGQWCGKCVSVMVSTCMIVLQIGYTRLLSINHNSIYSTVDFVSRV